jgi:hypothetical protein
VSLVVLFSTIVTACALETPVVEFTFDSPDLQQTSSGTAAAQGEVTPPGRIGRPGSGVSGKAEDRAFDNTGANGMGGRATEDASGLFSVPEVAGAQGMRTMTVALWFKTAVGEKLGSGVRLAMLGNAWSVLSGAPGRSELSISGTPSAKSAVDDYAEEEEWVFLAITFDVGSKTVGFFKGTSQDPVKEVGVVTDYSVGMNNSPGPLMIGNTPTLNRPFNGYLDNFRLWRAILDISDLEALRRSDLAHDH